MEKINAILAKETLNEADIKFLMTNISSLPESGKIRLGLVSAPASIEVVKELVIEIPPVSGVVKAAKKIKEEQDVIANEAIKKFRKGGKK